MVAVKHDFKIVLRQGHRRRGGKRSSDDVANERRISRLGRGARQKTVVQEFLPGFLEVSGPGERAEGLTCDVVPLGRSGTAEMREDFDLAQAVKQRRDQRLDRNQRAVAGAGIAP